jgi:hypothetical protein
LHASFAQFLSRIRGLNIDAIDFKVFMWHLSDMLQWLQQKMAYKVSESDLQLAEETKQVNLAKSLPAVNKQLLKDIKPLIY